MKKLVVTLDPRKLQTTIIADSTIVTNFVYNALGELIQSTDPNNHSTSYTYNNFGQKTSRIHPDAGTDLFTYDLAGNLISRQTQDLINNSMTINYDYHYNQMTAIHYPKNPENDVYYFYGDNSATDNRKGRVYAIEDASGRQEFSYGRMGEVVKNIRTFALPNEQNTYTFAMKFEYDSWNRILGTTYPDGEHVRYWYNTGGQLSKMASSYNNVNYNYIDSITYNKFEKRTKICYGNGTKAEYTYDVLQRLVHLKSTSASGIMQKIEYSFDLVNNIKRIDNVAGVLSNGLGGTYRHEYQYDNTYRLTSSNGSWDNNNNSISYNLNLAYTMDGRIQTKTQSGSTLIGGNLSSFSYDNQYSYNTNQPHTVRWIDDNVNQAINDFKWDANGNLIFHKYSYPENITRQLCWDEENRLMAVGDNKYTSYYVYDNGGERTYKLTGPNTYMNINGSWINFAQMNNPTLYTSAYLVAGVQGYTKHYYAGSERISSAIGLGGLSGIDHPLMNPEFWDKKGKMLNKQMDRVLRDCIGVLFDAHEFRLDKLYFYKNAESGKMDRYFYHPDHLGSSSWITDNTGRPIQHLHYLPFGEDWVDQRNSSWNAPYTFSGKEKDVETGYGYFGARYYDSGLSIWLSVDPMSDKYPSMSPYNYCANNPVILVDPDGREWLNAVDEIFGKILIEAAEIEKTVNSKWIKKYEKKIEKLRSNNADETEIQKYENYKKELETQNEFLDEGIATLNFCGSKDNNQKYTFSEIKNQNSHVLQDTRTGVITFQFDGTTTTAWHEIQHYTDFLKGRFEISFENIRNSDQKMLKSGQRQNAEIRAYQSEYSFGGYKNFRSLEEVANDVRNMHP